MAAVASEGAAYAFSPPPPHIAPLLDLDRLRRDGYLVLPQVVPAAQLAALRDHAELLYERTHETMWSGNRAADSQQPRVLFEHVVSPEHCDVMEFVLGPTTRGVCQALMGGDDAGVEVLPVETAMLTNPRHEYGPVDWHRDLIPGKTGPLEGYTVGFTRARPNYLQWNIP